MFLLVLDKDPVKSADLVPDKLKFKQLIELGQLICSVGISDVFKLIKQGKELQKWILKNKCWVYVYYSRLLFWAIPNVNMKIDTMAKLIEIKNNLMYSIENKNNIDTAIFRYSKDYQSDIPTNTELPIDECIEQYKKYVEWKKLKDVKGYV
jgi:hypothetical protein